MSADFTTCESPQATETDAQDRSQNIMKEYAKPRGTFGENFVGILRVFRTALNFYNIL